METIKRREWRAALCMAQNGCKETHDVIDFWGALFVQRVETSSCLQIFLYAAEWIQKSWKWQNV